MDPIAILISVGASLVTGGTAYGLLIGRVGTVERRLDDDVRIKAERVAEEGRARDAAYLRLSSLEATAALLVGDCKVLAQRIETLDAQHDRLSGDLRAMETRILDGVKGMIEALRRELDAAGAIVRPERR